MLIDVQKSKNNSVFDLLKNEENTEDTRIECQTRILKIFIQKLTTRLTEALEKSRKSEKDFVSFVELLESIIFGFKNENDENMVHRNSTAEMKLKNYLDEVLSFAQLLFIFSQNITYFNSYLERLDDEVHIEHINPENSKLLDSPEVVAPHSPLDRLINTLKDHSLRFVEYGVELRQEDQQARNKVHILVLALRQIKIQFSKNLKVLKGSKLQLTRSLLQKFEGGKDFHYVPESKEFLEIQKQIVHQKEKKLVRIDTLEKKAALFNYGLRNMNLGP